MDRQRMLRCLEQVGAYRASGVRANEWAVANGVPLRSLSSWCAHARRWQALIDGVGYEPAAKRRAGAGGGFVAAAIASANATDAPPAASIRIELQAGASHLDLHWPMAHARELATWLRELGR